MFYADGKVVDWVGHSLLFATEDEAIEYGEYWKWQEGYDYKVEEYYGNYKKTYGKQSP